MNPEDAIRRLRAEDRWVPMEPRFLHASDRSERGSSGSRPTTGIRASRVRVGLVAAVVLAVLAVGTASIIRAAAPAGPPIGASPTATAEPTPSPTSTPGTVDALPPVRGRVLATWTDESRLPATAVLDAGGRSIAVTFTCTGGGELHYSILGRSDSARGCNGITSGGPELMSKDGRLISEHRVTVHVSVTGHPRFALRVIAVPVTAAPTEPSAPTVAPTGPAVPASLRTCGPNDLAPTASYRRWPHFQGGLLTIRSAASTDCAIRTFPTLRYLDSTGKTIGGPADRLGDGAAPPVRLGAHGTAYLQIELFALNRLRDCRAKPVTGLALDIGAAHVRVPVPASPPVGKCTDSDVVADGVGPVTAYRPSAP